MRISSFLVGVDILSFVDADPSLPHTAVGTNATSTSQGNISDAFSQATTRTDLNRINDNNALTLPGNSSSIASS